MPVYQLMKLPFTGHTEYHRAPPLLGYKRKVPIRSGHHLIGAKTDAHSSTSVLGRTAKLRNDVLMFQQHHGESLSEAWTHFKNLLQKVPHHGIDLWLKVQFFYDHVNPVIRRMMRYFTFEDLEDFHVTGAHLDKKTYEDYRTYTKISQDNVLRRWETESQIHHPSPQCVRILLPDSLLILPPKKGPQNPQRYPDVTTTSWRIFIEGMDSFSRTYSKSTSSWHRSFGSQVQVFMRPFINPITRRTIDQSASGKLLDLNAEESWALLEDLTLYDNKSWNDPKDFAKPVKAIALPQDVPNTSDRRLSKFKADFKQKQSKMTNKIDTVLKAITDRIASTLPSDMVKNPKLSATLVLSACSYPTIDPQCSSYPSNSINSIKAHF
ncbi:hypothetical protein Tco_0371912 [Tanacetum coccineum]